MSILEEAKRIVYEDREKTYGDPGKNLRNIALLWEIYLYGRGLLHVHGYGLTADDVAHMMILLKVARLINAPGHLDSLTDICGYAALIERVRQDNIG